MNTQKKFESFINEVRLVTGVHAQRDEPPELDSGEICQSEWRVPQIQRKSEPCYLLHHENSEFRRTLQIPRTHAQFRGKVRPILLPTAARRYLIILLINSN